MNCVHCNHAKVTRPRGLCWTCYYTPGVKEQHPSTSKFARRGVGGGNHSRPLAPAPTTAAPGTPEKAAVMAIRVRLGHAIFHPQDARYADSPRPGAALREAAG